MIIDLSHKVGNIGMPDSCMPPYFAGHVMSCKNHFFIPTDLLLTLEIPTEIEKTAKGDYS